MKSGAPKHSDQMPCLKTRPRCNSAVDDGTGYWANHKGRWFVYMLVVDELLLRPQALQAPRRQDQILESTR